MNIVASQSLQGQIFGRRGKGKISFGKIFFEEIRESLDLWGVEVIFERLIKLLSIKKFLKNQAE
jgi:hypothetical protein